MNTKFGKIISSTLAITALTASFSFAGCGKEADLRVYNCEEYIDETLIEKFEQEYGVTVEYSCFDTPEDCYNSLKIDGDAYDLICPSDYMIEKMAREGMLEEIELAADGAYKQNVSPFIENTFNSISFGEGKTLANYAAGYMWGTLGLVYNPKAVDVADMNSWMSLWNDDYRGRFSIKDSVRDTYFIGLANYYQDELLECAADYAAGGSKDTYQSALRAAFNDTTENTVSAVKNALTDLKERSYGMEVDSGKDYIITGDIDIYFAWSGDAVYAMDEAEAVEVEDEDQRKILYYSIPDEGSNVWFDGWCVPKDAKNKDLALKFIDFLSEPENVIANMEYIGYVSCVAGSEVFDWVVDSYGAADGEYSVDLSYFFGEGDYTVVYDTKGRQFTASYPSEEVLDRCVVMNYFPDEANERINQMWSEVKVH